MIYAFFLFVFVKKSFLTKKFFLFAEINLTTRCPLYTCLVSNRKFPHWCNAIWLRMQCRLPSRISKIVKNVFFILCLCPFIDILHYQCDGPFDDVRLTCNICRAAMKSSYHIPAFRIFSTARSCDWLRNAYIVQK